MIPRRRLHARPVAVPLRSHAALRLEVPHLAARVVVGVDTATGRFVTAEQVDGNVRLLDHGVILEMPPDWGEGVRAPETPWNPDGRVASDLNFTAQDIVDGSFRSGRMTIRSGESLIRFEAHPGEVRPFSRPVVERAEAARERLALSAQLVSREEADATVPRVVVDPEKPGPATVVCSLGAKPLEYGGPSDGRGYSVLSLEQWQRMMRLCQTGEDEPGRDSRPQSGAQHGDEPGSQPGCQP